MKIPWRIALLAGFALLALGPTVRAGPFGYFTVAMFRPACLYCDCDKPYNAFTPIGYNPQLHWIAPAAARYGPKFASRVPAYGPVIGSPVYPFEAEGYPVESGSFPSESGGYPIEGVPSGPIDPGPIGSPYP